MKKVVEEVNNEFNGSVAKKEVKGKRIKKRSTLLISKKVVAVLILLLLVVVVWSMLQVRINESHFDKEKAQLMERNEIIIDSLQIEHLTFSTVVFSWSVRSELLRNNTENVNQLLTEFVKKSGANLVQVIDADDNTILLSSDKKFENTTYLGAFPEEIWETVRLKEKDADKVFTPVMGFSSMIGILLVVRNREVD